MKQVFAITLLFLPFLIASCDPTTSIDSTSPSFVGSPQMLPVSAQVTINNQLIELEVAKTPQEQSLGLMYRSSLPPNRGMLFSFNPPRETLFWMKNTIIPLDMIFLYQGKVKKVINNVPPCTSEPCPVYGPKGIVIDQVIELSAGKAAQLQVKIGDILQITATSEQNIKK